MQAVRLSLGISTGNNGKKLPIRKLLHPVSTKKVLMNALNRDLRIKGYMNTLSPANQERHIVADSQKREELTTKFIMQSSFIYNNIRRPNNQE